MKPSPRVILLALLLCAPAAASARVSNKPERPRGLASSSSEPRVQLGVFEGTGRACSGLLRITPRRLSWKTPFSSCPTLPFTLAERRQKDGTTRWIYQRVGAPKSCLYKVVILEKTVDPDERSSWDVYGFTSMKAYKSGSNVWLNCPLVKAD